MTEWKETKSDVNFWKPEIGDELIGKLISKREGDYGMQYNIETADGTIFCTPSHAVLQNRMAEVAIGTQVKIVLEREELPKVKGRNSTKIYKVFVKD